MTDDLTPAERRIGNILLQPRVYRFAGVEYTASARAPIIEYLTANPDAIAGYLDEVTESQRAIVERGDFRLAREYFAVICDVLADVAERQGRPVRR